MVPAQESSRATLHWEETDRMTSTAIWWIRRDFRLIDNQALSAAIRSADSVLPLFIIDPTLQARDAEKKKAYLFGALRGLAETIESQGGQLVLRQGEPDQVLSALMKQTRAVRIFAEADLSPYARTRDAGIQAIMPLTLTAGVTAIPPDVVLKADGTPYTVYTPFSKAWKRQPHPSASFDSVGVRWAAMKDIDSLPIPDEKPRYAADYLAQLKRFTNERIYHYQETRNRVDLNGTSGLSPAFHLGLISASQAVTLARNAMDSTEDPAFRKSAETWLNEVIWREFYSSILYHFPYVRHQAFREKYRSIQWLDDPAGLQAWQQGLTGYPIVDAAMRQMNTKGWMHNRARMIVASFLVKDLLIDWKLGEEYFMKKLVDGDVANNNGGWQWTAGVGTDAAPYFRIFNPVLQSKKFDPNGDYIRTYVPELSALPNKFIHEPWKLTPLDQQAYGVKLGKNYPQPILDHQFARQRTLEAYGEVK